MFSAQVGIHFKVSFLKRSLNFCYDQQNGIIHAADKETFEKLGIDKELVYDSNIQSIVLKEPEENEDNPEEIKQNTKQDDIDALQIQVDTFEEQVCVDLEALQEDLLKQKKENSSLQQSIKQIIEFQQELMDLTEDKEEQQAKLIIDQQDTINTLKSSIGILNKKIKESTETTSKKIEAIIELISEKNHSQSKQWPEVLKKYMSLDKIWNSMDNKSEAAILSIMFMIKKALEEKGTRFSQ
jgi:hypothetical protein